METYQALRTFADSWGLVFIATVFAVVVIRTYLLPGSRERADDAAAIPFREADGRE